VHVNAVGTYEPDAAEVDEAAIARSRLVVEQRSAALAEAGEIVRALRSGAITEAHILADLAELVAGTIVRRSPDEVTIFKSVGIAGEDLALAETALAQRW
jgi:ornithine cyclodeaminase